ncbi:sentrin-specific protease 8 [Anaeramoeba flamelloides]|uniref:Sentrin-specific protease 8 n=1 Tax=Anaeramoeba flamelloides TaxID=1746091 RepID=A0ABQ8YL45_9EUKA|nr:sentrin-specific protease 8 [Anaeramoeba flamelloides]
MGKEKKKKSKTKKNKISANVIQQFKNKSDMIPTTSTENLFETGTGSFSIQNITITEEDISNLKNYDYLSDSIINLYFKVKFANLDNFQKANIGYLNSFFITKLMNKNNTRKNLKRWISRKKLETKQLWFIPVHSKEHWFLLLIKFNIKDMFAQIYICDSMKQYNTSFKLEIIQNLKLFIPTLPIFQKFYIISNIIEVDVIQQNNDYDCGLFLINNFNIMFNTLSKIKNMESIIVYFDKLNDYNLFITRDDLFDLILNHKKNGKEKYYQQET